VPGSGSAEAHIAVDVIRLRRGAVTEMLNLEMNTVHGRGLTCQLNVRSCQFTVRIGEHKKPCALFWASRNRPGRHPSAAGQHKKGKNLTTKTRSISPRFIPIGGVIVLSDPSSRAACSRRGDLGSYGRRLPCDPGSRGPCSLAMTGWEKNDSQCQVLLRALFSSCSLCVFVVKSFACAGLARTWIVTVSV
jgi:hypothetical protein